MTRVKICGIKRLEDALMAVDLGADALGLLIGQRHASPDFITATQARSIVKKAPPFVSTVLVTHLSAGDDICDLVSEVQPTTLQLHGDSHPADAKAIRARFPHLKIYKALHANEVGVESATKSWSKVVDALLLDTSSPQTNQVGGTGKTHDWNVSANIVRTALVPVILAGGLNPNNVSAAIQKVRPYAVDVNSGTKGSDGFKDRDKLKRFIENAHQTQFTSSIANEDRVFAI